MGPETPLGEPKTNIWNWVHATKFLRPSGTNGVKATPSPRRVAMWFISTCVTLARKKLHERLPFICELAKAYVGVDPVKEPIPVRPTAHYTMGGIETDQNCETRIKGLFAVGECSSVGLHGANRLGSNSLAELVVFGRLAVNKRQSVQQLPVMATKRQLKRRQLALNNV